MIALSLETGPFTLEELVEWSDDYLARVGFQKHVQGSGGVSVGYPLAATLPPASELIPTVPGDTEARRRAVRKWALEILEKEKQKVRNALPGCWNNTLIAAAIALYEIVAAGALEADEVETALIEASAQRHHVGDEVAKTIASGRSRGMANPRDLTNVGTKVGQAPVNYWELGNVGHVPLAESPIDESGGLREYPLTDAGNSERYADLNGEYARFVAGWGKWIVWDEARWKVDVAKRAYHFGVRTARSIMSQAAIAQDDAEYKAIVGHALASEGKPRIDSMVAMASRIPGMNTEVDRLNKHPWKLNLPNGTLDLRDGQLHSHRKSDYLTQMSPVLFDPSASCPRWLQTLRLFLKDQELIDFWQRVCGYCLTGSTRDHFLGIAFGDGSNGKSTILETLMNVLGPDYAMKAPQGLLMAKQHESHPTETADFYGKRLVVAIETAESRQLNESLIKELTGGDKIRTRRMREDFWEFDPTHKILLATNHRPVVRGQDRGIWRRLKLIPFEVTMSDSDAVKGMSEILKSELPGILNWMLAGCLRWQAIGLSPPGSVVFATDEYKVEQDTFTPFLAEGCLIDPSVRVQAGELYKAYKRWAADCNTHPCSLTKFGKMITDKGFKKDSARLVTYIGIAVNSQYADPAETARPVMPSSSDEPMDFTGSGDTCDTY